MSRAFSLVLVSLTVVLANPLLSEPTYVRFAPVVDGQTAAYEAELNASCLHVAEGRTLKYTHAVEDVKLCTPQSDWWFCYCWFTFQLSACSTNTTEGKVFPWHFPPVRTLTEACDGPTAVVKSGTAHDRAALEQLVTSFFPEAVHFRPTDSEQTVAARWIVPALDRYHEIPQLRSPLFLLEQLWLVVMGGAAAPPKPS